MWKYFGNFRERIEGHSVYDVEQYWLRRARRTLGLILIAIASMVSWFAHVFLGWTLLQSALLMVMDIIWSSCLRSQRLGDLPRERSVLD
ncbi:MAG: hypothetical protein ACE5H4_07390 [Candidatus Thorarchaeota archaeon]